MIIIISLISLLPHEIELFEEDFSYTKIFFAPEVLFDFLNNPLDINLASYDDFSQLPFITAVLAKAIVEYRKKNGDFKNTDELLSVDGMDRKLLNENRQFLKDVRVMPTRKKIELKSRASIDSFADGPNNWKLMNRSKVNYGNLDLILISDKDELETDPFDFYGVSIDYSAVRNRLVIGNYLLSFGQGLVFSAPFYHFLTGKTFGSFKAKELSALTSPLENSSLFGLAYNRIFGNLSFITYFSTNQLDAKIDSTGSIVRIVYDGRHIDSAAMANKDRLREDLYGLRAEYRFRFVNFGFSSYHNHYNHNFVPADSNNSFFGNRLTLLGIDASVVLGNYHVYGELANSLGNGFGFASGIIGDWKGLKTSFNLIGLEKNFYSPHSRNYSIMNRQDNLNGNFNLRYDFYGFRLSFWGSTRNDFIVDSLPASIKFGMERKEGKFSVGLNYKRNYKDDICQNQGTRLDLKYDFSRDFNLGLRFEDRQSLTKTGRGMIFRLSGDLNRKRFNYTGSIYWFEITSSDTRIYAYEPGFSGLAGNHSFSNKGVRFYSFVAYNLKPIKAGLKIGLTKHDWVVYDYGAQVEVNL